MSLLNNPLDDPKHLHDFLFNMYDFAYLLSNHMLDMSKPYATDTLPYVFMAYIEDIMDIYGRKLVFDSAKEAGLNANESLKKANAKLDALREMLTNLKEIPPSSTAVDEASKRLKNNWGTRE